MQSAAGEDGASAMGLIDRLRSRRARGAAGDGRGRRGTLDRPSGSADLSHLEQFVATRRGVEGYVEPRTAVTETTILLVAADGEWTRRRIDGPDTARKLPTFGQGPFPVVAVAGLGAPQADGSYSAEAVRRAAGAASRA
uniref:hypothetical protein n=1 Tax=Modestobacter sp. KNN46-3 TaxID=2711218 RepID=UPI001F14B6AD